MYADGTRVIDLWNAHIPPSVLEEAAYRFIASGKAVSSEGHQRDANGKPIAIGRLIECQFWDAEKAAAFGFAGEVGKFAGLWVGIQIYDDAVWQRVQSGDLKDLSIGGTASFEEVDDPSLLEEACKKVKS